jgi:hypothetical protein
MKGHHTLAYTCVGVLAASIGPALAEFPTEEVPKTEPEYIAKAKTAAPPSIVNNATIIMPQSNGPPKVLQTGSNGFTCQVDGDGTPSCADQNAVEWRKAIGAKQTPPDITGFIYMLAGDTGTTNHSPYERATHQHWVQTGPHVMIVGKAAREMASHYPRDVDVKDPSQPYVMFPGTPAEHLMLPVAAEPAKR